LSKVRKNCDLLVLAPLFAIETMPLVLWRLSVVGSWFRNAGGAGRKNVRTWVKFVGKLAAPNALAAFAGARGVTTLKHKTPENNSNER
jgi:hypothetical protein